MIGHPTLGPAATVVVCSTGPADDAPATATFADLVCADPDLLRAEFDAIITANFPGPAEHPQRRDPAVTVATMADPDPRPGRPVGHGPRGRGPAFPAPHPRPRERGPPIRKATGRTQVSGHRR
ncbi:hypothetical protein ACVGOW_21290 [Pseudonocardia saturnea]